MQGKKRAINTLSCQTAHVQTDKLHLKKKTLIPPYLYHDVYLAIVTILTIFVSIEYTRMPQSRLKSDKAPKQIAALIVAILFAAFIGFRPISGAFVDMMNYLTMYNFFSHFRFEFSFDTDNVLFDNLQKWMAYMGYDIRLFFVLVAYIYFGCMFVAFRKMFPKDALYMLVIYLGAFSTFSYGTNGIKAGAAASLFLCAIAYRHNWKLLLLFCALSLGFHHSMVLPLVALGITVFYRNTKTYFGIWLVCILLAALHVTFFQGIFNGMTDEHGQGYLSSVDGQYSHGFRIDFIIYSAFPVISGYYAVFKHGYRSRLYTTMFNTYLLVNSVWMLCMYASFTNRIAYLSWQMLPVVLVYPFFDKEFVPRQYSKLNLVAWWHLGFTLFMSIIYYGFIK